MPMSSTLSTIRLVPLVQGSRWDFGATLCSLELLCDSLRSNNVIETSGWRIVPGTESTMAALPPSFAGDVEAKEDTTK